MSEKIQQSLSSFMKKQSAAKKNPEKKSSGEAAKAKAKADAKKDKAEGKDGLEEEMTEEEQVEEAKKASKGKAANYDTSGMYKKLIIESIVKYTIMIAVMVVFALGIIKLGPAAIDFFNNMIFKTLTSDFQKH